MLEESVGEVKVIKVCDQTIPARRNKVWKVTFADTSKMTFPNVDVLHVWRVAIAHSEKYRNGVAPISCELV